MRFHEFLQAVGSGPQGNRHLSREEMKVGMGMILDKQAVPEQISAFLLGWHVQGESKEELQGALDAMNERIKQIPLKRSLEIGYSLEGKTTSIPIMLLSAHMVPKIPLVVSGDRAQPTKLGFNPKDFSEQMRFSSNVHYFDRSDFLPELSKLTDLRRALGVYTAFNAIEKLHNAAQSDFAIVGIDDTPHFDLYKEIYGRYYKRLIIVRGSEGSPDVLKKSHVLVVEGGHSYSLPVDPADFGLGPYRCDKELSLAEMVKELQEPSELTLQYARLNAALLMYTANQTPSIEEGFKSLQGSYDKLVKKLLK